MEGKGGETGQWATVGGQIGGGGTSRGGAETAGTSRAVEFCSCGTAQESSNSVGRTLVHYLRASGELRCATSMGGSGAPNITSARNNATRGNKSETMESGRDKNLRAGMAELMRDFYSHAEP